MERLDKQQVLEKEVFGLPLSLLLGLLLLGLLGFDGLLFRNPFLLLGFGSFWPFFLLFLLMLCLLCFFCLILILLFFLLILFTKNLLRMLILIKSTVKEIPDIKDPILLLISLPQGSILRLLQPQKLILLCWRI